MTRDPPPEPADTSLSYGLRCQLQELRDAARAYLAARDRVDPAGEREARERLESALGRRG